MEIVVTILIGLALGALATTRLPKRDLQIAVIIMVLGVSGSVLGATLCPPLGLQADGRVSRLAASLGGASLFLGIPLLLFRRAQRS